MNINDIADRAFKHAESKGFYFAAPKYWIFRKLKEEIQEFEGSRDCDIKDVYKIYNEESNEFFIAPFERYVKNSTGDELADIIITALAGAKKLNIDIEKHINAKMKYNELREDHR